MDELVQEILVEVERAARKYGPPTSSHESYGVLAEEMAELLEAIQANARDEVRHEAMQVAAVALRLVRACDSEIEFQKRSGF